MAKKGKGGVRIVQRRTVWAWSDAELRQVIKFWARQGWRVVSRDQLKSGLFRASMNRAIIKELKGQGTKRRTRSYSAPRSYARAAQPKRKAKAA